jgi:hypothetical protein
MIFQRIAQNTIAYLLTRLMPQSLLFATEVEPALDTEKRLWEQSVANLYRLELLLILPLA